MAPALTSADLHAHQFKKGEVSRVFTNVYSLSDTDPATIFLVTAVEYLSS